MIFVLILFALGGLLYISTRIRENRLKIDHQTMIQKLVREGDLIEIDLSTIHIKHRSSKKEIMVDLLGNKINPSSIRTNSYYDFKKINTYRSELEIPVIYNGENISFFTVLLLDGHWLGIKFHIQKSTTLYIDKNDIEQSYIDFTFLDKPKINFTSVHRLDFYKNY